MRNNSQNAGCILRFPASHSCQPRRVQWMSAAAAVCEIPAASRAARTCAGSGFRAGLPARLRFGWLGIYTCAVVHSPLYRYSTRSIVRSFFNSLASCRRVLIEVVISVLPSVRHILTLHCCNRSLMRSDSASPACSRPKMIWVRDFILFLLPLFPRRGGLRCATHELNYTRIACNSKNFFELFFGGRSHQAKPSNAKVSEGENER